MDFYIKQGDTLPIFAVQLVDDYGNPFNLAGCSVKLIIDTIGEKEMNIIDVPNGIAIYKFTKEDTKDYGTYLAELKIVYNNGDTRTVPTIGNIKIHVYHTLSEVIE